MHQWMEEPTVRRSASRTPASRSGAGLATGVIHAPYDRYEQEADRVAASVLRAPPPATSHACACGGSCPRCQAADRSLRSGATPHPLPNPEIAALPPRFAAVTRSPGRPMSPRLRGDLERRFGHDFGAVRIHDDANAAAAARSVQARAFTVGQHIAFGAGEQAASRQTLAHELTHVVQQGAARRLGPSPSSSGLDRGLRMPRPVVQRQALAPGLPRSEPAEFTGCTPETTGLDAPQFVINLIIRQAIARATVWAEAAVAATDAILQGNASQDQRGALASNFGAHLPTWAVRTLNHRYRRIIRRLRLQDRRNLVVCNPPTSFYCQQHGWAAYTTCPTQDEAAHLCPPALVGGGAEGHPAATMLHEAGRAIGLCGDCVPVWAPNYSVGPPARTLDNICAYAAFARSPLIHGP